MFGRLIKFSSVAGIPLGAGFWRRVRLKTNIVESTRLDGAPKMLVIKACNLAETALKTNGYIHEMLLTLASLLKLTTC